MNATEAGGLTTSGAVGTPLSLGVGLASASAVHVANGAADGLRDPDGDHRNDGVRGRPGA